MKTIAARRAALDLEEARLLRAVIATKLWERFGMVSPLDYLERTLGYAPRTASDRLRVATELQALPAIEHELGAGRPSFSAVKELTRVATAAVEHDWIAWAMDKTVRDIEQKVARHEKGDRPDDVEVPPGARNQRVVLDLPPEIYARWRQAQAVISDEHGRRLDDAAFVAALLEAALDNHAGTAEMGKERYQIAVTVCSECKAATQEGGGLQVPIGEAALERASCDAVIIGSIDGAWPERATRTISPAIRRFVMHRDGRCCRIPGCRSAKSLDLHHIEHRTDGGPHDPENLLTTCDSCHRAHHEGLLVIRGTSSKLIVERPSLGTGVIQVGDFDAAIATPNPVRAHVGRVRSVRDDAEAALVALGFTATTARVALDQVDDELDAVEDVIRAALRYCPRPRG